MGTGRHNRLAPGVLLSFYQFTWNRGRDWTDRILLFDDGRLYVGRRRAINLRRPGRPSCRVKPVVVAAVRKAIAAQRLSDLAPYFFLGWRRQGCSADCHEPACARGDCYELAMTSIGRILDLQVRWQGDTRRILFENAKDHRVWQRLTAVLAPLRACRAVLARTSFGTVPLWEKAVD